MRKALASTTAAPASWAPPRSRVMNLLKMDMRISLALFSGGGVEVVAQVGGGADGVFRQHAHLDDHRLQGGLAGQLAEELVIVPSGDGGDAEVGQRHQLLGLQEEDVEARLVLLLVHRPQKGRDDDLLGAYRQEDRQVA